jgi:hypothetical protein
VGPPGGRWRRVWQRVTRAVDWVPPTSDEVGTVAKCGLAAGLAWWISISITDVPNPVLASLTAVVVVPASARASVFTALQRTALWCSACWPRWRSVPRSR